MRFAGFLHERGLVILAVSIAMLAGTLLLSGCSEPTRAKVVSREQPAYKTGKRPSHYRVRRGDTLFTIAWNYGFDYKTLARWNRIAPPYTIYPGQTIRLSGPASTRRSARSVQRSVPKKTTVKTPPSSTKRQPATATQQKSAKPSSPDPTTSNRRLRWQWPTKGELEQRYSAGDPTRKGIKIAGTKGQPVLAAESGKVVYAGSGLIGYGLLIIIKHNKNYLSAYGHNRKLLVKEGAVVSKGKKIAEMGQKGGGRPLLHFEIRRNGTPVNPLKLLPRRP